MALIEMTVEGIGIDPHNNPLVLLRDAERRTFIPIWIGPSEAVSIQMELDSKQPARPMTHDLIANVFRDLGIRLLKVTVHDFEESVYYATLHLQVGRHEDNVQEVDARPSDAIALALRAQCQILVSDRVATKTGIQVEEVDGTPVIGPREAGASSQGPAGSPEEIDKFVKLLEGVDLEKESDKN